MNLTKTIRPKLLNIFKTRYLNLLNLKEPERDNATKPVIFLRLLFKVVGFAFVMNSRNVKRINLRMV